MAQRLLDASESLVEAKSNESVAILPFFEYKPTKLYDNVNQFQFGVYIW